MLRPLILLFAFITLCSANLYGQEAQKPSPAVKKILDKAVIEVKKNRQAFDKSNEKPLGDALVALKQLSTKLIEEGKNVDATAVLKQMETLDADVMKMAKAPEPLPFAGDRGRVPPRKPLLARLEGKWNRSNSELYWIIMADGTAGARRKANNTPTHADSRVRIISEDVAEITWPGGLVWRMREAGDDMLAVEEIQVSGKLLHDGLVITRAK